MKSHSRTIIHIPIFLNPAQGTGYAPHFLWYSDKLVCRGEVFETSKICLNGFRSGVSAFYRISFLV